MQLKKFFKPFIVFLAVIIASFSFSLPALALQTPHVYEAKNLKEFTHIDGSWCYVRDTNNTWSENLNLRWDSSYADSFNVPYLLCTTESSRAFNQFNINLDSTLPPLYADTTNYYVKLPLVFLIVGTEQTFYPSTEFKMLMCLKSGTVLEFDASDYSYYDGNRDRFCASFNFVVSGVILNNVDYFIFYGMRTVAKKGPLRISVNGSMTVDKYDDSAVYVDKILESNIYNSNRIIDNQNKLSEEALKGWNGDSLDSSSKDKLDSVESGIADTEATVIIGFDEHGNPITQKGSFNDLSNVALSNVLNGALQYLNGRQALMAVTNFLSRLFYIPELSTLLTFSLAFGVIPLIVGLGINAGRGSDKRAARQAARSAEKARHSQIMNSLNRRK